MKPEKSDHPSSQPELIDHIGLDLWRATQGWKSRYVARMVDLGFPYFAEARGGLIAHIDRAGTAQADLVVKAGMTKQAVQQLLDELERDGVVRRVADPADARRKIVEFTDAGDAALEAANGIKRQLEEDYRGLLGGPGLETLKVALTKIADHDAARND